MKYPSWCSILMVFLIHTSPLYAQSENVGFQESSFTVEQGLTTEEGLPANGVNSLLQDSEGYIWGATYNGLVRYDGYKFKVFDANNVSGLESSRFLGVYEDDQGRIWAGLEYNNLIRIDNDSVKVFKIEPENSGSNIHISEIAFSPDGKVWVGTNYGLFVYEDEVFKHLDNLVQETVEKIIHNEDYVYALFSDKLYRLFPDGTEDRVLLEIDQNEMLQTPFQNETGTMQFESFADMAVEGETIRVLSHGGMAKIYGDSYITLFKREDIRQELTYGFFSKGDTLFVYGSDGLSEVTGADNNSLKVTKYTDYHLRDAIMDHEGSYWLATTANGIRQLVSTPVYQGKDYHSLLGKSVTAILGTRDETLFAGTNCNGLYAFQNDGLSIFGEADGIENTCVWSLMEQNNGTLWAGTWGKGAFFRRDGEEEFQPFKAENMDGVNAIISIYEDKVGDIWFGSYYNGLFKKSGDQVKAIRNENGNVLGSVRTFFEDKKDDRLWIATDQGAGYIRDDEFIIPLELQPLTTYNIRTISKDDTGRFWFGSYGGGLFVYSPLDKQLKQITLVEGLYDNTVSQFSFDLSGDIWLAGNLGVFYIERTNMDAFLQGELDQLRVSKIGVNKGLPIRETTGGFMPSSYIDESGVLYIPTVQGMAAIYTGNINLNRKVPSVNIDQIELDGESYIPGQLPEVSYKNQRMVFYFNALSFINSDYVEYRYKLEGFNEDWQEADQIPQAVYTSLSPGEYTFRVIASNDDGFWNDEGARFSFVIPPPFWQTSWFYGLCFLLLIASVTGITKYRTRLLKKRKKELEQQVEEQTTTIRKEKERVEEAYSELEKSKQLVELNKQTIEEQAELLREQDEIKSRFFANISYELRTPLSLIKGMIQQALKGKYGSFGEKLTREFSAMMSHTNRLNTQVDYLLELSNIEIGDVEFNPRFYDLNAQVSLLEDVFETWAGQNGIQFEFIAANAPLYIHADPEKMEQILTSSFAKAMQFTEKDGWIKVQTTVQESNSEGNRIKLLISCKAKNLSEKDKKLIFDRFYYQSRIPGVPFHVGLALIKEWMDLLDGNILIESSGQETIEIQIYLPLVDVNADEQADLEPVNKVYQKSGVQNGVKEKDQFSDKKKTILLADDNELSRQYIRQVLKGTYNILEAEDGNTALQKITQGKTPIDLVISEVMLPGMDGNELSRKLRSNSQTGTIPVVLLTAKAGDENYLAGLKSGADAYITKPFKESILRETLKNLISNRNYLLHKIRDDQNLQRMVLEQTEHSLLAKLDKIIDDNLDNADLGIEDIANQLHMGQRQLQRKIKQQTDLTPKQYLRKRRLNAAKLLIDQNYGTITEVAYATGFNTLSLFSSYFKEEFGELPSERNNS